MNPQTRGYINQHSPEFIAEQQQLDLLALLSSILDRVQCIRVHAWHEANWQQVYTEATRAIEELEAVKAEESARWAEWNAAVEAAARGEE